MEWLDVDKMAPRVELTALEVARQKIEGQVMDRFNHDRSCCARFFDCGETGFLEIMWMSGKWRTGWYDSSPFVSIDQFLKENEPETGYWDAEAPK